jgi:hypothetical protein
MATRKKISNYRRTLHVRFNLLNFAGIDETVNFRYLHFVLSECSCLVEADGLEPGTLHCLLNLRPDDTLTLQSFEAEGIGKVEHNWVGCRETISDKVEEAEHYHNCVDPQREHLTEGGEVYYYAYYQNLDQKVY